MAIKIVKKNPEAIAAQVAAQPSPAPVAAVPTPTPQPKQEEAPTASPAPTAQPVAQDILQALKVWASGDRKKVLMLVNRETGAAWKVLDFDTGTGRARLQDTKGMQISPIPRERETQLYYPMWR